MKRALLAPMMGSFALAFGCAGVNKNATDTGTAGSGNATGLGGLGGTSSPPPMPCQGVCTDFPATPITEGSVPGNAADIFGTPGDSGSGGPCVIEPQDNTLLPNNWLRPRFRFTGGAGLIYEIRLHANNQANDLVVYTSNTTWTMPKTIWTALASHTRDAPIEVTVRSAPSGGGQVMMGSKVYFTIAPVKANGQLVYWSTSGTTYFNGQPTGTETVLNGFAVGDEGVVEVLRPYMGTTPQVAMSTYDQGLNTRRVKCIGCHTSTPDGAYIAFNDFYPWGAVLASGKSPAGAAPPADILGAGGVNAITQPWVGITSFSPAHWTTGDRIMVAPLGTCNVNGAPLQPCNRGNGQDMDQQSGLAWFDLESAAPVSDQNNWAASLRTAGAWNWIYAPVTGAYAAAPSFSHDGTKVLFTMTDKVKSGRLATTQNAHLYMVPYSKTAPQAATPVMGDGSAAGKVQYYGTLSADDKLIAYNELDASVAGMQHPALDQMDINSGVTLDGMYAQPQTEIFVISSGGGTKRRLGANSPAQCPGQPQSPGINNSWPKWSPQVETNGNRTYYWLIFSSWREGAKYPTGGPIAQLYMTAVTTDETGMATAYPAVYLWNQPATSSNHTPAWDRFQIPDVQ